ncbi:MAG TPA: NAD(P)H-dependent oxidoreductase [Gammaproteobacteria bacterium]|nr:NAD(P)H-dependent oxidoreductase [Gammaproteobacteria bacterium]
MPTLLHIDSSPMLENSVTRRLTVHFVRRWREQVPEGKVIRRDLGKAPPPHPDALTLEAAALPAGARNARQRAAAAHADLLLEELEAADVVLLGAPMYNFSVTSGLKAWFDLVSRPGRTFRYGPEGHEGLLADKTIVAVTARGGFYELAAADSDSEDLQEALIRHFFGFMGLADIRFIHAEGQGIDPHTALTHEQRARAEIDRMLTGGLASRVA